MTEDRLALDPEGFARLAELAGGDEAFVDELLDTYLVDGDDQVDRLRTAVSRGDLPAMVIAAHSLKTNSENVGAVRVAELARDLETDARLERIHDGPGHVEAIAQAFEAARTELLVMRGRA
jgi:HPt (histidine-containing phosphotransfer) domain-containing protein